MSTRCQIGIFENSKDLAKPDFLMYKHSDGYPEGVLPLLEPFLKRFYQERGFDPEYLMAWMVHEFISERVKWQKRNHRIYVKKDPAMVRYYPKDGRCWVDYGVCGDRKLHGDIEYFYAIFKDRLEVYKADIPYDLSTKKDGKPKFELLKTIWLKAED